MISKIFCSIRYMFLLKQMNIISKYSNAQHKTQE